MALRAMRQMKVSFGILTEAKLTDGIYTRFCENYHVVATNARAHNQGGVALFYEDSPLWQVEEIKTYGPNETRVGATTGLKPKSEKGIPFDMQPEPLRVPRASIATDYARNLR